MRLRGFPPDGEGSVSYVGTKAGGIVGFASNIWLDKLDSVVRSRPYESSWINGPVDLNTFTTPGVYWITGDFLNGDAPDPNTYHVPGNTGMLRLEVTVVRDAPVAIVCQDFVGGYSPTRGHRICEAGSWSSWMGG